MFTTGQIIKLKLVLYYWKAEIYNFLIHFKDTKNYKISKCNYTRNIISVEGKFPKHFVIIVFAKLFRNKEIWRSGVFFLNRSRSDPAKKNLLIWNQTREKESIFSHCRNMFAQLLHFEPTQALIGACLAQSVCDNDQQLSHIVQRTC